MTSNATDVRANYKYTLRATTIGGLIVVGIGILITRLVETLSPELFSNLAAGALGIITFMRMLNATYVWVEPVTNSHKPGLVFFRCALSAVISFGIACLVAWLSQMVILFLAS